MNLEWGRAFNKWDPPQGVWVCSHLGWNIGQVDGLLQVAHHHQIAGLVPSVVQRIMVDVTQHGPRTNTTQVCALVIINILGE